MGDIAISISILAEMLLLVRVADFAVAPIEPSSGTGRARQRDIRENFFGLIKIHAKVWA